MGHIIRNSVGSRVRTRGSYSEGVQEWFLGSVNVFSTIQGIWHGIHKPHRLIPSLFHFNSVRNHETQLATKVNLGLAFATQMRIRTWSNTNVF